MAGVLGDNGLLGGLLGGDGGLLSGVVGEDGLVGGLLGGDGGLLAAMDRRYRVKVKSRVREALGMTGATA